MIAGSPSAAKRLISQENYKFLQRYVHEQTGIVLDGTKEYLFESRLGPVLRKRNVTDLDSLCALLRVTSDSSVRRDVLEAMTTNETLFFRDQAPFEALKSRILPELIEKNGRTRTIGIWSAAASTGQELYSIAMLLVEAGLAGWTLRLLGTDYSEQVLERAREGKFMQIEVSRGLPVAYLIKYFDRRGLNWEIKPEIRRMVRFEQQDLRKDTRRLGPFDVVFCRNVLIYFDMATKQSVLQQIASTMHPGGYLLLGSSETLLNLNCPFERTQAGQTTLYKRRQAES